jgi:hypothetical protein
MTTGQAVTVVRHDRCTHTLARDLHVCWHGSNGIWRPLAHDDRNPSLSVRDGNTGPQLTCHGECDNRDVFQALRDRGLIGGMPAEAYLASRGIDPDKLLTDPLCWPEPLAWHDEQRALIVAVNDASGTGLREAGKALAHLRSLPQIKTVRVMSTEVLGTDAADLIEGPADV